MFKKGYISGNRNKNIEWKIDEKGCWICTSHSIKSNGYPMKQINKKKYLISHLVYIDNFGEIPSGMVICHKCDNPACINPEHLFLGTQLDNINDRCKKGRSSHGEKHGLKIRGDKNYRSKLTEKEVVEILRNTSLNQTELSIKYNTTVKHINGIINGRSWKHVWNKYEISNPMPAKNIYKRIDNFKNRSETR